MTTDKKFKSKFERELGPLSFAQFMLASRTSLGLTQEQFGKKLGTSRANICDIEKGRQIVSAEFAVRVAKKSGLSEKLALQACLQDQVSKTGVTAIVSLS